MDLHQQTQQPSTIMNQSKRLARVFLNDEFDDNCINHHQQQQQSMIDLPSDYCSNNVNNNNIYTEPTIVNTPNSLNQEKSDSLTIIGHDVAITLKQGQLTQTLLNCDDNNVRLNQPLGNQMHMLQQQSQHLQQQPEQQQVIIISNRMEFLPLCDLLFNIISLASYFCDLVFDLVTTYQLYLNRQFKWFAISMIIIIMTMIINQLLSYKWWYRSATTAPTSTNQQRIQIPQNDRRLMTIIHVLQCGVLYRYFKLFAPVNLLTVKREVSELCLLRMIHSFVEAAPMLLIQTYLLWHKKSMIKIFENDLQLISILLSLFSICWSLSSFNKNICPKKIHRLILTWCGVIFQFFWRLGTIISRVVALTVYAVLYEQWLFIVIGLHWFSMLLWLLTPHCLQQLDYEDNDKISNESTLKYRLKKLFNASLLAWIYVFCFVNMEDNPSRYRMLAYYLIMFAENILLLCISIFFDNRFSTIQSYRNLAICLVIVSFMFGILFMCLYYRYFHIRNLKPTESNKNNAQERRFYTRENHVSSNNLPMTIANQQQHTQSLSMNKFDNRISPKEKSIIDQLLMNQSMQNSFKDIDPKLLPFTLTMPTSSSSSSLINHQQQNLGELSKTLQHNDQMIPGVFSCRLNSAVLKRKKKKPSTIPPLPISNNLLVDNNGQCYDNKPQQLESISENAEIVNNESSIINQSINHWKSGLNSKNFLMQQIQRPLTNPNCILKRQQSPLFMKQSSYGHKMANNQLLIGQQRSLSISPAKMMNNMHSQMILPQSTIKFTDKLNNEEIIKPKPITSSISNDNSTDKQQQQQQQKNQEIFEIFNLQRPPVPGSESRISIESQTDHLNGKIAGKIMKNHSRHSTRMAQRHRKNRSNGSKRRLKSMMTQSIDNQSSSSTSSIQSSDTNTSGDEGDVESDVQNCTQNNVFINEKSLNYDQVFDRIVDYNNHSIDGYGQIVTNYVTNAAINQHPMMINIKSNRNTPL